MITRTNPVIQTDQWADGQVVDEAARIAVVYVFVTSRCDG